MAPGFAPEERAVAVTLTRMMFPFLMLVSVGALAMGVLNSLGSFFIPAIAPALSNLAYIIFLLATKSHLSVVEPRLRGADGRCVSTCCSRYIGARG